MCTKIANWIMEDAKRNSRTGSWVEYYEEIVYYFGVTTEWIDKFAHSICCKFDPDVVAYYTYGDGCIDVILYADCLECEEA